MKKLLLILLIIPFLAHAQWYQLDSITDQSLNAVSFTDENTGYVAGENGTLFKTTDAGENWFQLELNTDYNITDMCFPAVDTGYIICNKQDFSGERFKIYKTVNGGTYWTEQDSLIGSDSTRILNENTGYAVGSYGLIWKTTNGGVFINSELLSTNVDIYPNPADDFVYITTDLPQHGSFIFNILDINGKIIKHGVIDDKHKKISIANIKSGRYIIKLITSKGEINCKSFVKL